ncbi:hypothetical protein EDD27_7734 [Nonomuraea polychroma]|uniref:Secreted protein n=1 Tax=Nonomuraea polychroma TaxID=46176 RepID=A0A438MHP9_9ACTN|nr:hypothetical protein [Nonomuraea polychroma]RVX44961.1 hypothetical protein EDD27_7734 [Nonomuraea polychroma]
MPTMTTIVAVAAAAIVIAAIGFVVVQQRWQGTRRRVDPQPATSERDNSGGAERELPSRQGRAATLDIKPLTTESQQTYAQGWTTLQKQFVHAPGPAVTEADRLVTAAMAERGYPTEDLEQQQSDLPVMHGRTLHHYRQAHEISGRVAQGDASLEDLRQAMVHYHVLFQELLDNTDEHRHPRPPTEPATTDQHRRENPETAREKGDST